MFHGFTGNRDELPVPTTEDGVFSRISRLLVNADYTGLRIDLRGSAEKADTTFEGQVANGLKTVELMSKVPRVKGDDLATLGWIQGGVVAKAVAGRSGTPDTVAL